MKNKWSLRRTPPITPIASPKLVPAKAGIDLSMPRRMRKQYELLSRPLARLTNIIRYDRDAAFEAVLITQSLEDPFAE